MSVLLGLQRTADFPNAPSPEDVEAMLLGTASGSPLQQSARIELDALAAERVALAAVTSRLESADWGYAARIAGFDEGDPSIGVRLALVRAYWASWKYAEKWFGEDDRRRQLEQVSEGLASLADRVDQFQENTVEPELSRLGLAASAALPLTEYASRLRKVSASALRQSGPKFRMRLLPDELFEPDNDRDQKRLAELIEIDSESGRVSLRAGVTDEEVEALSEGMARRIEADRLPWTLAGREPAFLLFVRLCEIYQLNFGRRPATHHTIVETSRRERDQGHGDRRLAKSVAHFTKFIDVAHQCLGLRLLGPGEKDVLFRKLKAFAAAKYLLDLAFDMAAGTDQRLIQGERLPSAQLIEQLDMLDAGDLIAP